MGCCVPLFFSFLLCVFLVQYSDGYLVSNGLQRGRSHVCSREVSRNVRFVTSAWRTTYSYYNTKCGFWGWGRCRRSRSRRVLYYSISQRTEYGTSLYCCRGWQRVSTSCSSAICSSGCHHGSCIAPNNCRCNSGWKGRTCAEDVNECSSGAHNCQQGCNNNPGSFSCGCYRGYVRSTSTTCRDINECTRSVCSCAHSVGCSICTNTAGSYRCSCKHGYRLLPSTSNTCVDIDECSRPESNSCAHKCINGIGSYSCTCRPGYASEQNGRVCKDEIECGVNNGNCEHSCQNTPGSFKCSCRQGFSLDSNGRTCSDIDECAGSHPCEMNCNNTIGSYTCWCHKGFKLNSDKRTCSDIDECSPLKVDGVKMAVTLANCEQTCTNTDGSFICGCRQGYRLLYDRKRCTDIDECKAGTHQCDQTCVNTRGSYRCRCVTGYTLAANQKTCKALPCELIEKPSHGRMVCTGMATTDKCTFSCLHGYDLDGPSIRTCLPTSNWTGTTAICKSKSCGKLFPPSHGLVSLPCYRRYGSTCRMRCIKDYYSVGNDVGQCGLIGDKTGVEWRKSSFSCKKMETCAPNPCQHGGTCHALTKMFKCDCTNTGYQGNLCEQGVIEIPSFPKLKANIPSEIVHIHARPSHELQITLQSDEGVVTRPERVKIANPNTEATLAVTSKTAGLKSIAYSVKGESAKDFIPPAEDIVFVSPNLPYNDSVYTELAILPGELPIGCHAKESNSFKCNAKVLSTLPWTRHSRDGHQSTLGIVHVVTRGGVAVPLSLIGLETPFSRKGLIRMIKHMDQNIKSTSIALRIGNNCYTRKSLLLQVLELVEHDAFIKSFFNAFSTIAPAWFEIKGKLRTSLFDINSIHAGDSTSKYCPFLTKYQHAVSLQPIIGAKLVLDGEDLVLSEGKGLCYAIDVCTSGISISFSKRHSKTLTAYSYFQNMKNVGWDISLQGLSIPGKRESTVMFEVPIWNGKRIKMVSSAKYKMLLHGGMKVKVQTSNKHNISLDYEGKVYMDMNNISKLFAYGFESEITSIYKGKASLNMTTSAFGKTFTIKFPKNDIIGRSLFGGKKQKQSKTCSSIQGLFMRWKNLENPWIGTPFISMIKPRTGTPLYVAIGHQINGGKQTGISNLNEFNVKFILYSFLLPQLRSIITDAKAFLPDKKENLEKWAHILADAVPVIGRLRVIAGRGLFAEEDTYEFKHQVSNLRDKLDLVPHICEHVIALIKRHSRTPQAPTIVTRINQFMINLPKLPRVIINSNPVQQKLQSFLVKMIGAICVKRLCIDNMDITLETSPSFSCNFEGTGKVGLESSFTIIGTALSTLRLGQILSFLKHGEAFYEIPNGNAPVELHFKAEAHILEIRRNVDVLVKGDQLEFQTSGLIFGGNKASINVTSSINTGEWDSLSYHLIGKFDKSSGLVKKLEDQINQHLHTLAKKAKQRVNSAGKVLKDAQRRKREVRPVLAEKVKALQKANQEKRRYSRMLNLAKVHYYQAKTSVNTTLLSDKKEKFNICETKQCKQICSETTICTVVQVKLVISVTKENCKKEQKVVFVEKIVKRSVPDFYYVPIFETIYTGNCYSGLRHLNAAGTGFVLGATVGSLLGGGVVGGLAGGAIGTSVGALISLSSGCDDTYEVISRPAKKITYTRFWTGLVREKKYVPVFICSEPTVVEKLTNSYGQPSLRCHKDSCIKIANPKCVKNNVICVKRMKLMSSQNMSEYDRVMIESRKKLAVLGEKMEVASMNVLSANSKADVALQELKMERARFNQLESSLNISLDAITEIKRLSKLGLKITTLLEKTHDNKTVKLSGISFGMRLTQRKTKQIPLDVAVKTIDDKKITVHFVMDFNQEDASLHEFTKNVIQDLYGQEFATRRRRAIPFVLAENTVNSTNDRKTLDHHRLCLTAREANIYYQDVVQSLDDLITAREVMDRKTKRGIKALNSIYHVFDNIAGPEARGSIASSFRALIRSLVESQQQNTRLVSWNETLMSWRSFLDVLTNEKKLPECSGVQDCVFEIGDTLEELYLFEKGLKRADEIRELLPRIKNRMINLITQNHTLDEAKANVKKLLYLLERVKDDVVLCGQTPEFIKASNGELILLAGAQLTLSCEATSKTPIKYTWLRNNATLSTAIEGNLTISNVNETHGGAYKCKAINRRGSVTSNVTIITIHRKPRITLHPNDSQVAVASNIGVTLRCNATGEPRPVISWFFLPHNKNNSSIKIESGNDSFLYFDQPRQNDSGYYFCRASNMHGVVESKMAKLWVLNFTSGTPRVAATVNVTTRIGRRLNSSQANDLNKELEVRVKSAIEVSMNSSSANISHFSYISYGRGTATVSFLYSSKNPDTRDDVTYDAILKRFATDRMQLVDDLRKLHSDMANGSFRVSLDDGDIVGDPESLVMWIVPPGCPLGKTPHPNGFVCVSCLPGTHGDDEGQCNPCPIGTYQFDQGQRQCVHCGDGLRTRSNGSINSNDCFSMRLLPPRNLKASALDSTTLVIHWSTQEEDRDYITHYVMKYGELEEYATTLHLPNRRTNDYRWKLSGLKKFTNYSITVYAVSSGKNKNGKISKITARTGEDVPDAVPAIASVRSPSAGSINVTWHPIPHSQRNGIILAYQVYYKESSRANYGMVIVKRDTTSAIVNGLKPYTWYCVRMSASTNKGPFPDWNDVQACTWVQTKSAAPTKPRGVSGRAIGATKIQLKWRVALYRNRFIRNYFVYYGQARDSLVKRIKCYWSSCLITGLKKNTQYFFKVRAFTGQHGQLSDVVAVTT